MGEYVKLVGRVACLYASLACKVRYTSITEHKRTKVSYISPPLCKIRHAKYIPSPSHLIHPSPPHLYTALQHAPSCSSNNIPKTPDQPSGKVVSVSIQIHDLTFPSKTSVQHLSTLITTLGNFSSPLIAVQLIVRHIHQSHSPFYGAQPRYVAFTPSHGSPGHNRQPYHQYSVSGLHLHQRQHPQSSQPIKHILQSECMRSAISPLRGDTCEKK
jgi:hypothetical protein